MHKYKNISDPVIRRLPRYYRFLGELLDSLDGQSRGVGDILDRHNARLN